MQKFKERVRLSKFSNYRIGGPARFFFEPKNEAEVRGAILAAREKKIPFFVIGGGTNLLIDDRGVKGLVIRPGMTKIAVAGTTVAAGAGASMADLLSFAARHSLSGLEWAGGLPGTVGGAVRGNAGCFGGETKDSIASVRSFDTKTMKVVIHSAARCGFGYRSSLFKKTAGRYIILDATFRLAKGDRAAIGRAMREKIAHRRERHPLEYPNIGSMFKNVPVASLFPKGSPAYRKAVRDGALTLRGSPFSVKRDPFPVIFAAKLISEAGLRGVRRGGAEISSKHTNFIVNVRKARAKDVRTLMRLVKAGVRRKFGVQLEEEVQALP